MSPSRFVWLLLAVVTVSARAHAQTCPTPPNWRAPLVVMCPDQPALASNVNANFGQIVTWLEAKVGQVGMPVVLPANSVTSSNIVAGAVGTTQLALASVGPNVLQDATVTQAKLGAGNRAIYEQDVNCPNGGTVTRMATCTFVTTTCSSACAGGILRFKDCAGACAPCPGTQAPQICTPNNLLLGYLVPP